MANYVQTHSGIIVPEAQFAEMLSKKPVTQEIATAGNGRDITKGYLPENVLMAAGDTVLASKGGDYSIYDDIARDEQVKTCRQQRELALVAKEWGVEPGDSSRKAKKAADRVELLLDRLAWDDKTQKMLSAVLYGYAVGEVMWATDGTEITLSDIKVRNRSRFGFLPSGELRMRTQEAMTEGEALPAGKFWAFSCGADHDDDPYGLGLGHYLYWPVFFKKNGVKFWLQFLEKFGQPTAVGKYPAGSSDQEKNRLLQALSAIQSSTAIRIPEGMVVELLEATRSGTADYTALFDRMNAAISKVYLGHTGSTDSTAGKLGGEDNAGEVRDDLIKADADLVCGSFNRTVATWLTWYNDGEGVKPPRVWRNTEPPEDLKGSAETDKLIFDMGFRPTLKYVTEKYGEGYEAGPTAEPNTSVERVGIEAPIRQDALDMDAQANKDVTEEGTGRDIAPAQFAEKDDSNIDPTPVESQAEQLARNAGPSLKAMVGTIADKVDKAASLEALRDDLLNSYADLDNRELVQVMALAFAAADLAGRFDVDAGG